MDKFTEDLIVMLNKALKLEHAANIQYLSHAELVTGINAETVEARLKELASDEQKHAAMFRKMIGAYLGGEPTLEVDETFSGADKDIKQILKLNLGQEKEAVDFYKQIYAEVMGNKDKLPYCLETLEHELRHIIIDEQEHIVELSLLLGL